MDKRIVTLGAVAAVMSLGAGSAVAVGDINQTDTTDQANLAKQCNWQENSPWQKSIQDHPNAQAVASADTGVAIGAGGNSIGSSNSGNGAVGAVTYGGWAGADAENEIDVDQGGLTNASKQGANQGNLNLTFKLNVSGTTVL